MYTKYERGLQYDKPPVRISRSGVPFVRPADILNSRIGREIIQEANKSAVRREEATRERELAGVRPQ